MPGIQGKFRGPDLASIFGTALGLLGVAGCQLLVGGRLGQLSQLGAAFVVLGGTGGAMLLAFPSRDLRLAFGSLGRIYSADSRAAGEELSPQLGEILRIAAIARREGLLALEGHRGEIGNPAFARAIRLAIDGCDPATVREVLDAEIDHGYEGGEAAARVFEGAGGFAPTIGIVGAVLGLMHVMSHVMTQLGEPSRIGEGLAAAFVSTLYGVALANLLLLPWASKLRRKTALGMAGLELAKLGALGIMEGLSPHSLEEKLRAFLNLDERGRAVRS